MSEEKYNRWTVLGPGKTPLHRKCQCSCGKVREVNIKNMRAGLSKSCGCHKREQQTKHGLSRSRTYQSYLSMKDRVVNNLRYVSKGIKVCDRWMGPQGFINFVADMGEAPDGMSLDRFPDPDGDYEPNNCRWATDSEQQRNKSSTRMYTWNGKTQCLYAWADELGVDENTLHNRLWRGWSVDDAFTIPIGGRRGPKGKKTLSPEEITEIRRRYHKGSHTDGAPALGREFGVSYQTIIRVVLATIQRYNPPDVELPDGEDHCFLRYDHEDES